MKKADEEEFVIVLQSRADMLRDGDQIAGNITRVTYWFPKEKGCWGELESRHVNPKGEEDDYLKDRVKLASILDEVSRSHYKHPVFMTRAVWDIIEKSINHPNWFNDLKGVWHDILWMSHKFCSMVNESTAHFMVVITGAGRKRKFYMKAVIEAADYNNPAPVVTIALKSED